MGGNKAVISIQSVAKTFGDVQSLDKVTARIGEGSIFGLIGSNGSGKSTLLRVMAGILRPDTGEVKYDGVPVWDRPDVKKRIFYISDDQFFLPGSDILENAKFLSSLYPNYDVEEALRLARAFNLPEKRKIQSFSKGMQKRTAILLGLAAKPDWLFCDESFDGLDPVMREIVKKLFAREVAERKMTAVIASHSLRELEDICDHIGLLHKGGILFESDIDELKSQLHTVQAGFEKLPERIRCDGLHFVRITGRGNFITAVVGGEEEAVRAYFSSLSPLYFELIPLTLEEIFIAEMEARGYDSGSFLE